MGWELPREVLCNLDGVETGQQ